MNRQLLYRNSYLLVKVYVLGVTEKRINNLEILFELVLSMESLNIARSAEGHAAKAGVDKWVLIQENTFRNWVNEQLRPAGLEVSNLEEDFDDGVKLCALIQALQGKRVRANKSVKNQHQQLANVAEALTAIANDNIRLVNIGKTLHVVSLICQPGLHIVVLYPGH